MEADRGVVVGQTARTEENLRPAAGKVYHALAGMAEDFTLFTPALVCIVGRFPRDPVAEFLRTTELPEELHPFSVDTDTPVFKLPAVSVFRSLSGEYSVHWAHRVYAIPHAGWEACRDFIVKIAIFDAGSRYYAEMGYHTLNAVDVVGLGQGHTVEATLPRVPIESFAVSSNRSLVFLCESKDPVDYLPRPVVRPPIREIVATANQLLAAKGDLGSRLDVAGKTAYTATVGASE